MSLYDRLIIFKRIPYILYWLLLGIIFIGVEMFFMLVFRETGVTSTFIFAGTVWIVGVIIGWQTTIRGFKGVIRKLDDILVLPSESWIEEKYLDLFTLRTLSAKLVVIIGCIAIMATVFLIGWPLRTTGMSIVGVIELPFFLGICWHGAYFYFNLLILLFQIARLPIRNSFYRVNHPAITSLYQYYSGITLTVLFLYIAGSVILWQSPFGLVSTLSVWFIIFAFYPISYFIWSYLQIHTLMYRLKQANIGVINQQVLDILVVLRSKACKETAEVLKELMEIQEKIENLHEWPFEIQGTAAFLIAIVIPIIQVGLALFKK